ncbi:MAG TPA: PEP/pyruvate-binding domain-containing protein, partial [Gemmatimonadaceae bacterium]|nr:PEP/pyruvate-binding domain-containing protein [Gemmatimonadaceae bacterium]
MTLPTSADTSARPSSPPSPYVLWFRDGSRADVGRAGGKGANLCEMTRAGLPVPPGFVVTVEAHRRFTEANGLDAWIAERLARLDVDAPDQLRATSEAIQARLRQAPVPDDVHEAVSAAYAALSREAGTDDALVAVRSSGTVEDTAQFSFAGMFQSTLNVHGDAALVRAVKDCWASGYTARLLFYRVKQGIDGELRIAAVVQRMVNADRSGVVFTADPSTNDRGRIVIEGAWGLGEVVVLGQVTPDRWVVDKATLAIVERATGRKD